MEYQALLSRLLMDAHFENRDDAERALATTLETLASTLPLDTVEQLGEALPSTCAETLAFGLGLRTSRKCAADPAARERMVASLPWYTVERIQAVSSVLADRLEPSLVSEITRQLPARLGRVFTVATRARAQVERAHGAAARVPPMGDSDQERRAPSPFARPLARGWDNGAGNDMDTRRIRRR